MHRCVTLQSMLLAALLASGSAMATPPAVAHSDASTPRIPVQHYLRAQQRVEVAPHRKLNLFCTGRGTPTVLLDAGLGNTSLTWQQVQGALSGDTRVCSFDRAGYGFSDPAGTPPTLQSSVDDIAALIDNACLEPPVVLVAHSLGGMQALLFAFEKPERLAGMVLVDPSYPGQPRTGGEDEQIESIATCLGAARAGTLSGTGVPASLRDCLDYPQKYADPALHREINRQYARPQTYAAMLAEAKGLQALDGNGETENERILYAHWRNLGAMPLTILSAGTVWAANEHMTAAAARRKWAQHIEGHRRLAALSSRGKDIVVPRTTHNIQELQPQAVVKAIEDVLATIRGDAKSQ